MKIKEFFLKILAIIIFPWLLVKKLFRILGLIYGYILHASTVTIEKIFTNTSSNTRSRKVKRILYVVFIIIPLIILSLWVIIRQNAFFVPVGGGAVVTRFGAYNRSVSTGIHLKIPVIERYYIVYKGFIKQQTFGYYQVKPPIDHQNLTKSEIKTTQAKDAKTARDESDHDVFPKKGGLISVLTQDQRLTSQYTRELAGHSRPLTLDQALEIRKRNDIHKRSAESGGLSMNGRLDDPSEGLIISHDLNVIDLRWAVQYNIDDMSDYLFNSKDADQNLRDISLSVMNKLIAKYDFFEILTTQRENIEIQARKEMQKEMDRLKLGLHITNLIIVDALPPKSVQFAFDEVNSATQKVQTIIYHAQREFNKSVFTAQGQANEIIQQAHGRAVMIKQLAEGDVKQFDMILNVYQSWPDIVKDKLYIDTMNSLFKDQNVTLIDSNIQGIMPIFPLNNSLRDSNSFHDMRKIINETPSPKIKGSTNMNSSSIKSESAHENI